MSGERPASPGGRSCAAGRLKARHSLSRHYYLADELVTRDDNQLRIFNLLGEETLKCLLRESILQLKILNSQETAAVIP